MTFQINQFYIKANNELMNNSDFLTFRLMNILKIKRRQTTGKIHIVDVSIGYDGKDFVNGFKTVLVKYKILKT